MSDLLALMPARFADKLQVIDSGCWEWIGWRDRDGYGQFWHEGRHIGAHRFSYQLAVGPIPEGLLPDHFLYPNGGCIGPGCASPEHTRPVTARENALRSSGFPATNRAKTHCPAGHEYTAENTNLYRGWRYCRRCQRDRHRAHAGLAAGP